MAVLLGVDVGGTFTDAVLAADGTLHTAKAPTTPGDESEGVMAAVGAVLERAGRRAAEVSGFAHGMTVATNALLEGRGARTALVATEGFADLVELGRQARADLYRLCAARPAPLASPELRFEAAERMTPDGPLRPLSEDAVAALCEELATAGPEAVAVVLLHSYRHPEHERALGAAIARALPEAHVSLSHEVVGTFREYERAATTEVDAALSPLLRGYLGRLVERAHHEGLPEPAIMQSSGGLADAALAAAHAALTVLSGPAAGVEGAAFLAARCDQPQVLCFDMGGTSCDVCAIQDGEVAEVGAREIAGRPLALPSLDIHTVGAGGGSVAWRDAGGALRVGPRSAGARPGPACYGWGGTEPTVTDANLLLGRLPAGGELAGGVALDREAAARAVAGLAGELGLSETACAEGIARVAGVEMARALRVVSVERGLDPRDNALLCFGGAGPMHAAAVADELGMTRVLCPPTSGVLAALGLVVAERRRDAQRSVLLAGDRLTDGALAEAHDRLGTRASAALGERDATLRCVYELRYAGQSFELPVRRAGGPATATELRAAFAAAHEQRYGYTDAEATVELVTMRVTAAVPGPELEPVPAGGAARAPAGRRAVVFAGEALDAAVWEGAPAPGARLPGPAVCELGEATLVVPPGWSCRTHTSGTIVMERE